MEAVDGEEIGQWDLVAGDRVDLRPRRRYGIHTSVAVGPDGHLPFDEDGTLKKATITGVLHEFSAVHTAPSRDVRLRVGSTCRDPARRARTSRPAPRGRRRAASR